MIARVALFCVALATPAFAEKPLTGAEFEAFTTGKIMDHAISGRVYGAEKYFPDRRVRWAFTGDECMEGSWYDKGTLICFVYEDRPEPECFSYLRKGAGLVAIPEYDSLSAPANPVDLFETNRPLACLGPEVGV
jgi:hypothetical protein